MISFPSLVFGVLFLESVFAAVAFRNFSCRSSVQLDKNERTHASIVFHVSLQHGDKDSETGGKLCSNAEKQELKCCICTILSQLLLKSVRVGSEIPRFMIVVNQGFYARSNGFG